jgi:LPS sulfotransferase NodH
MRRAALARTTTGGTQKRVGSFGEGVKHEFGKAQAQVDPAMSTAPGHAAKRPDTIDLIGPEFDCPSPEPARRTLIICAAPRTGSYELCRHLVAAGIGVPHEYFNRIYARDLASRWGFETDPLGEAELPRYMDLLRRRRGQGGVFAVKLQFRHFDRFLRNRAGAALFEGASVVHLFRSDAAGQYASFLAAAKTGTWDFSPRRTTSPRLQQRGNAREFIKEALGDLSMLLNEDAGFRGLFVLLGIRPIFVTTEELFRDPRGAIRSIADAVATPINEDALKRSIALSAPYGRDGEREKAVAGLIDAFKRLAFERRS